MKGKISLVIIIMLIVLFYFLGGLANDMGYSYLSFKFWLLMVIAFMILFLGIVIGIIQREQ